MKRGYEREEGVMKLQGYGANEIQFLQHAGNDKQLKTVVDGDG